MPHLPLERAGGFHPHLVAAMGEFSIDTPRRAAAWLAQVAHESQELMRLVENLNYSAAGLRKTWPSRFPNDEVARFYAKQPMAIANHVYANRLGNGNDASGDGWRFRGRGAIMTTGRSNYRTLAQAIGLPLLEDPDLLAVDPAAVCRSAGHFWRSRGLNQIADEGTPASFERSTWRINGGLTGLAGRVAYWERAKKELGG